MDARPTSLGRLVSLLFRPPVLSVTIAYADGSSEQDRLVSALGRSGFLLGPRVADTADMLLLLLPERRAPRYRPVSIRLAGAPGTTWLWQDGYGLELRAIALPVQTDVRRLIAIAPFVAAAGTGSTPSSSGAAGGADLAVGPPEKL